MRLARRDHVKAAVARVLVRRQAQARADARDVHGLHEQVLTRMVHAVE